MEPQIRLNFDTRLCLPNHALFVGSTQSGKTTLFTHILANSQLFDPKPVRILFHYDQLQDCYLYLKEKLAQEGIELLLIKGCSNMSLDSIEKLDGQTFLVPVVLSRFLLWFGLPWL